MAVFQDVTHPDKPYWKNVPKKDLFAYYKKIAKWILPHLKNRPVVLHRYPSGISKGGFFQKDIGKEPPSFLKTVKVKHANREISYAVVQNQKSLLYLANLGTIEFHPFNSKISSLETPDFIAWDLDPSGTSFDRVVETALLLKERLNQMKMRPFCKTTGGKGLHIFVALHKKMNHLESRKFAKSIAKEIVQTNSSFTTLQRSLKARKNKVYIDCEQNATGKTLIAPYSVKAAKEPTVSTPLSWSEVKKGLDPKKFTIYTVPSRLAKKSKAALHYT